MRNEEHRAQCAVIKWASLQTGRHPELETLFAIPNGGDRDVRVAVKLKREGVKAGMPDLCLPVPKKGKAALYIEMKTDKGRISTKQVTVHDLLESWGNMVVVARGAEEAIRAIELYLTPERISRGSETPLT